MLSWRLGGGEGGRDGNGANGVIGLCQRRSGVF